ncbi:MAG: nitrate/nitrite transporter NrtS [Pseudomonadota bacterium]
MQQAVRWLRVPSRMSADPRRSELPAVLCRPVLRRAFLVALIVGTLLNTINQGDILVAGEAVNWLKVGLTYCVPFLVTLYGAHCAMRMAPVALARESDQERRS